MRIVAIGVALRNSEKDRPTRGNGPSRRSGTNLRLLSTRQGGPAPKGHRLGGLGQRAAIYRERDFVCCPSLSPRCSTSRRGLP